MEKLAVNEGSFYVYRAAPVGIVDGDTVDFDVDLGFGVRKRMRIRVAGIDTPEIHGVPKDSDEFKDGLVAMDRVRYALTGSRGQYRECLIRTYKDRTGKYGRYLADIYYPSEDGGVQQEFMFEKRAYLSLSKFLLDEGVAEEYPKR